MDKSEDESLPEINPENLPEIVKQLGPEETANLLALGMEVTSRQHIGPLPSSEDFERYEKSKPGAAERILAHMEREQSFRHSYMEKEQSFRQEMVKNERKDLRTEAMMGQSFGLIVMLALIGGGLFSVYLQAHPTVTIAFIGATAVGAVKYFIDGRSKSKKE